MIRIHHLNHSQSERIIWLCEEIELPYEIEYHQRDPVTLLSPPALKALHPLAAAPVIEDGNLILPESGAIIEYILAKYGAGRLRLGPDHPNFASFLYWLHFSGTNLQAAMTRGVFMARTGLPTDHPVRQAMQDRLERAWRLLEDHLAEATYLAGDDFTAADIMVVFSLTTMRLYQPVDLAVYPNIRAYLARIGDRPAYRRAMAKGDPDLTPMLR
jgi:glutathione S-transferase